MSLVAPSAKVVEKCGARLGSYCDTKGIISEEQCGFGPARSKKGMLFDVRRLQELGRARQTSLYICASSTSVKRMTPCDRELMWVELTRLRVPDNIYRFSPVPRTQVSSRAYGC